MVAANHLFDVLKGTPRNSAARTAIPEADLNCLRLLRDVYEHWQQHRFAPPEAPRQAEQALKQLYPTAEPWQAEVHPDGRVLIARFVDVSALIEKLEVLEGLLQQETELSR